MATIIGRTLTVTGDLYAEEDLQVDGHVNGTLHAPQHQVTVRTGGHVTAGVLAAVIVVAGHVDGVIRATREIDVLETASTAGELTAPRIAIQAGARVKAKVNTKTADAAIEVARHRLRPDQAP